ncbi:procathepsin L-like [Liolophura sinensis]|uniref:procathepsin L-like n=1 Tax=Liolophura sinensis TaxID=3198878 RepID=UPI0031583EB8
MLRVAVVVALLALATAAPFATELDGEWQMFKATYKKVYKPEEEAKRRAIWEDNVKFIQVHNLQADRGVHTFTVGMNEYGDMSVEEFVQVMNGYKMTNTTRTGSAFIPPSNIALPTSVDWRTQGYVTPVKNQRQCGSCWAFSTTGSLEGQHFKKTGSLVSLSEQNLMDCSKKEGNMGCNGGLMDQAFEYIKKNGGVDTEASYPYKAKNERCRFKAADVGATDTGFSDIKRGSESELQAAVASEGPISVAIDAGHQSFQLYRSGVYYERKCSSSRLDHGVLAVGYGSESGSDYWLVKNSWGEQWGQQGYVMMSRNRKNNCGIATQASFPLV